MDLQSMAYHNVLSCAGGGGETWPLIGAWVHNFSANTFPTLRDQYVVTTVFHHSKKYCKFKSLSCKNCMSSKRQRWLYRGLYDRIYEPWLSPMDWSFGEHLSRSFSVWLLPTALTKPRRRFLAWGFWCSNKPGKNVEYCRHMKLRVQSLWAITATV